MPGDQGSSLKIDDGHIPSDSAPPAGSLRELMAVAIPLVLSSGSVSLMLTIDRLFLTWYSTDALAASTPASALHWTMMSAFVGTVNYVNTFIAQYEGARQPNRVVASVWQGIFLSLGTGVLFVGLIPLAPSLFAIVAHPPEVQRLEVRFFSLLCLGALPMFLTMAFACFYSGRGKTRIVMYNNFLLAAVNIALDPFLIFGIGPFPRLGIAGAAIATDIAYLVSVMAYLILSFRERDCIAYGFWRGRKRDWELFRRLLRYGLPTGLQMTAEISAFSVFLFLVGHLGTEQLAATNLAFNINMLSFVPMLGVGTAVMTIVGRRIGEGRPELAVRTTWLAAGSTAVYMLLFAILFVAFPETILRPFLGMSGTGELADIRHHVVVLLRFVAFYTFFDGMVIVFAFAVRGAGDTRFPFVYTLILAWSLLVLPTAIIVGTGHGGLFAAWTACSTYICLLGIGFFIRFLQGRWKTMSVIGKSAPRRNPSLELLGGAPQVPGAELADLSSRSL